MRPTRSVSTWLPRALLALPLLLILACAARSPDVPGGDGETGSQHGTQAIAEPPVPGEVAAPSTPQHDRDAPFELAQLMDDPAWIGRFPEDPWWSSSGETVFFWRREAKSRRGRELVALDLETGTERVLEGAERVMAEAPGAVFDPARRRVAFVRAGDLFVRELDQPAPRQLTRTREAVSDPLWLDDGARIAFRRGGTWLARDLASGLEEELAPLLLREDPRQAEEARERSFLEEQQERLFEAVRTRRAERERAIERELELEAADPTRPPRPWYLGKGGRILEQELSPGGPLLALRRGPERAERGERDSMAEWITDSGLVTARQVRVNVGSERRGPETLCVLDLASRERVEVDLAPWLVDPAAQADALDEAASSIELDPRPAQLAAAEERSDRGAATDGDGDDGAPSPPVAKTAASSPPGVYLPRLEWAPRGERLAVLARSADRRERWILVLEDRGREVRPVHHLHDPAWINGRFDRLGWLPDGERLWFLSEESGWSQLHLWDAATGETRALTGGEQEVDQVHATPDGRWLLYRSNHGHPGVREVWRVDPAGGAPERLTGHGGQLEHWPSPDGERLLLRASRPLEPPELYVQDARPGAQPRRLTSSMSAEFEALPWVAPELVPVPARHGRPVWSRLFLPPPEHLPPAGERPAVLFVHGAGYLQSAHAGWPRYLRETLFHTLLARRGAVVLDMDYRASAGYGRDWRTAIHLAAGEPELDDLEDGVAWLVREHGVDPERVGVYGGSYGGFLVLQALFTRPALFACGAALRPVTDWAHYNHGYTANLLDVPDAQPEAYARSSPIEHAAGLAAPLLICHGLVDDNVLAKDSLRLVQRLIELGKEDFELALYPVEAHGFTEPTSWLDQYRRILRLFERHLGL